jgi:8-oxo-dGTP pyrophosphatase MutT (NUDIX family)
MVRAGAVIYHIFNDVVHILLVKSSNPKFGGPDFQVPKGLCDPDESVEDAAIREADEEAGLNRSNMISIAPLCVYNSIHIYGIKVSDMTDFHKPDYEIGETKWFTLSEAFKVIRGFQKPYLGAFVHYLRKVT